MDFWNKARSIAEEAAKRSQDLNLGVKTSKLSNIISETSKEIAAQASKRADQLRAEAIKRADQIKHLAEGATTDGPNTPQSQPDDLHLETYGITEELREFVTGITVTTFRDFPLQDDTELYDVPAVSNVRQDLTEWQEKHASLVLSTVKEISRLRYELCPRVMKERKFWRIYFILVNSHVAPYENQYMEDAKLKSSEQVKDHKVMEMEPLDDGLTTNQEEQDAKLKSSEQVKDHKVTRPLEVGSTSSQEKQEAKKETKTSSSAIEQDLDQFLLGDSDDDQDNGDEDLDDDLDKLVDSSDDEKEKS